MRKRTMTIELNTDQTGLAEDDFNEQRFVNAEELVAQVRQWANESPVEPQ